MNTYMIPREAVNENRFLIFSATAAVFTLIAFGIGLIFVGLFKLLGNVLDISWFVIIGWVICIIFSGIGYVLGTFNIPESNLCDFLKKTGGESSYTIVKRVLKFRKNRKIYIYERS